MHPRTAPVVGLKGPLALGHGCHSSLRLATTSDARVWMRSPLVSSSFPRCRRGLRKIPDRSRFATFGRLFEGTDEISLGQTSADAPGNVDISHSSHRPAVAKKSPPGNVAERLALTQKTVSFWQCRSHNGAATRQRSEDARTGREPTECGTTVTSPDPAASPPVDNRATAAVLIHRLWITMWTVRLRSLGGPLDQLEGVPVIDS